MAQIRNPNALPFRVFRPLDSKELTQKPKLNREGTGLEFLEIPCRVSRVGLDGLADILIEFRELSHHVPPILIIAGLRAFLHNAIAAGVCDNAAIMQLRVSDFC